MYVSSKWYDGNNNLCEPLPVAGQVVSSLRASPGNGTSCVVISHNLSRHRERFTKYRKGSQRAYLYLILSRYLSSWTYLDIKVKLSKMMIINYLNLTSNIS